MTMNNEDPILSPENQTQQALMRAASVKDGREAALWAVAAAVFSLRDTVERATTPPAMVDPGQLTPEEIESIRRGPFGYVPTFAPDPRVRTTWGPGVPPRTDLADHVQEVMNRNPASQSQLGGRVGSQAPRPAVTREQVAMAITDASDHCRGSKLACNLTHLCPCYRQVAAVMKLLEGGE
jgi:hypothetical protein